jgi:hypothetical protein
MLENTHRFAIHIRICKEATDEDREMAMGQLRKTKKYALKGVDNSVASQLHMQQVEVPQKMEEHLTSALVLAAHQHTTPSNTRDFYYPARQQNTLDLFDDYLERTAHGGESQSKKAAPISLLGVFEDPLYTSVASSTPEFFNCYDQSSSYAVPTSCSSAAGPDSFEEASCSMFDNQYFSWANCAPTTMMYDHDGGAHDEQPVIHQRLHDCNQQQAANPYWSGSQQHFSSWHAVSAPSIDPQLPPAKSQGVIV